MTSMIIAHCSSIAVELVDPWRHDDMDDAGIDMKGVGEFADSVDNRRARWRAGR